MSHFLKTKKQFSIGLILSAFVLNFPCYSESIKTEIKKDTWKQYWSHIDLINDPELFQSKKRKDRLASVTQTDPINLSKLTDSEKLFKTWIFKKKKLTEFISTIKNWNVDSHSYDKTKKVLLLKGTLLRGNKIVFFKEWYFYNKKHFFQLLIEDTQKFNETDKDIVSLLDFLQNRMIKK